MWDTNPKCNPWKEKREISLLAPSPRPRIWSKSKWNLVTWSEIKRISWTKIKRKCYKLRRIKKQTIMFFLLRINFMTIVHWKLQLRDHPWWEPHLVTCLTLCTSSKPTKVKMGKMVCIIIKGNLVDIEQTLRPNLLVSKNLQLTEIGNYNPEDNQVLIEIDHMLFPIYNMIHSLKIINLTEA